MLVLACGPSEEDVAAAAAALIAERDAAAARADSVRQAARPVTITLIDSTVTIPSGSDFAIPFTPARRECFLRGRAVAESYDVQLTVLDEDALINWRRGLEVEAAYTSERVGAITLQERLLVRPGRRHFFVISNRYATWFGKTVQARVSITCG